MKQYADKAVARAIASFDSKNSENIAKSVDGKLKGFKDELLSSLSSLISIMVKNEVDKRLDKYTKELSDNFQDNTKDDKPLYITTSLVMQTLGVSRTTLWRLCKEGKLNPVKGLGKQNLYNKEEVNSLLLAKVDE